MYNMPSLIDNYLYNDANLISYWRLESNFTDAKGAYNLNASASAPTDVAGKFGNGKSFSGTAQYANNGTVANLRITGSQTWGCWIKPANIGAAQWIMAICEASPTNFVGLDTDGTDTKPIFNVSGTTPALVRSSVSLDNVNWFFVCGVYDVANAKLKIWVNATKTEATITSGTHTAGTTNGMGIATLGNYVASAWFNGVIDDAFVFNRALTDSEVVAIYEGSSPSFLMNLVGNFKNN
jgi:hypothetical protein